jgi:hypothetical protein
VAALIPSNALELPILIHRYLNLEGVAPGCRLVDQHQSHERQLE